MQTRKNVVIHEEDFSAITIIKPFSEEYLNYLFMIFEDAYGEMKGVLITRTELQKRLSLGDDEFNKIINKL